MSDTVKATISIGVIIVIAAIYCGIKEVLSGKRAKSGVDKQAFKELMDKILNPAEQWTTLFAYFNYWEKKGHTKTTYYYHYAIAFRNNELLVIPVSYDDGIFSAQEPMRVEREDLSKVEYNEAIQSTEFYDKNGERILEFLSPKVTSNTDARDVQLQFANKKKWLLILSLLRNLLNKRIKRLVSLFYKDTNFLCSVILPKVISNSVIE